MNLANTLYTLLGTLLALGLLVGIHEWGHFAVARLCGVKVLRFSLGFGKALISWQDKSGTAFSLAPIPLGGYVKMLDEREAPVADDELSQAFNRKPVSQRLAIVAAGPAANLVLAVVLLWIVGMLGYEEPKAYVGQVIEDSVAKQAGLKVDSEILSIDGEAVQDWSSAHQALLRRLGDTGSIRMEVRQNQNMAQNLTLPIQDWLAGEDQPNPIKALGMKPWQPNIPAQIGYLDPEGPAALAGLKMGDRILFMNEQPIKDWFSLVDWVRVHPNETVTIRVVRAAIESEIALILGEQDNPTEEGKKQGYMGIRPESVVWPADRLHRVEPGPIDAIGVAAERVWNIATLTLSSIEKMLTGSMSLKNLSGPITIARVAGDSAQTGLSTYLSFLALLSISLGVLNLLPIPVLDGGHLLMYSIEGLIGKPLPEKIQMWGMQLGTALVIGFMCIALYNDVIRL